MRIYSCVSSRISYQSDVPKSKESFHQVPSAAVEHDYSLMDDAENGTEPSAVVEYDYSLMDDAENGTDLEDDDASHQTDSSESENDELFSYEMPSINPVDPVDNIKEAKCVDDNLIYPNARITNAVSMLLIMTFALKHKLSGIAIRDLLSLVDMHCLVPNPLLKSLFKFKQYFQSLKNPLKKHYFYSKCSISLKHDRVQECPNVACK